MNIKEGISQEYLDAYQKGWLNLTLGANLIDSSPSRPMKAYTCKFCKRKFNSPQALGGHQNAHRWERGAARRYLTLETNDLPAVNSMVNKRSLGVQAQTPAQPPSRDDETTIARFYDDGARFEATLVQPCDGEETVSQPSSPHMLDLNLKL